MTPDSLQPETEIRPPTYDEFKKNRPAWTASLRRGMEYALFRFGLLLGKNLSLPRLQKMGRGVGNFAYKVLRKDRGIVEKQLEIIFPELDAASCAARSAKFESTSLAGYLDVLNILRIIL